MKSLRLVLAVVLLSLSTVAFAQSGAQTPDAQMTDMQKTEAQIDLKTSDAQKSFDQLKTLAGDWEGSVTTVPPQPDIEGKAIQVSLRVTSMGNALVHEMTGAGRPDHPVTMLYLSGDRLLLTHYCDAGNRPRMTGKMSPDGKTVDFEFLDVDGGTQYGHMHHATFTVIDANHHIEDWTYMQPGDKPVHAHFEVQRMK
jgi:hypothetical protein